MPDRGFQSTFPRGERLLGKFIVPGHYHFNPRSLVGNDGIQQAINADTVAFQSTFPRGERRWKNLNVRCRRLFQSTFPRGERPDTRKMGMAHTNFNPRSLVGNDPPSAPATDTFVISIHVPSWGTTGPAVCDRFSIGLFQSTFPRGERHSAMRNFRSDSYFNPRSLVGNDQSQSSLLLIQEISIHVPSWGTTVREFEYFTFFFHFNPRSLVGNDEAETYRP